MTSNLQGLMTGTEFTWAAAVGMPGSCVPVPAACQDICPIFFEREIAVSMAFERAPINSGRN